MICNNKMIMNVLLPRISHWQNVLYNLPYGFRRLDFIVRNVVVWVFFLPAILEIGPNNFVFRFRLVLDWNAPHGCHKFWLSTSIHRHERFDVLLGSVCGILPLDQYTLEVYNCANFGWVPDRRRTKRVRPQQAMLVSVWKWRILLLFHPLPHLVVEVLAVWWYRINKYYLTSILALIYSASNSWYLFRATR